MNRKIIQKIIDALNEGTPDKVMYAIGALDMILESLPEKDVVKEEVDKSLNKMFDGPMSEASVLEKEAVARLKNIKDIAV